MTHPTHLLLGALIGYATGDYATALITSIAIDIDHVPSMIQKKVFKNKKRFITSITEVKSEYEAQRGFFHNVLSFTVISFAVYWIFPDIAWAFILSYFGHLMLDALDNADTSLLYPFSSMSIKGPINYYTKKEFIFAAILLVTFLALLITQ